MFDWTDLAIFIFIGIVIAAIIGIVWKFIQTHSQAYSKVTIEESLKLYNTALWNLAMAESNLKVKCRTTEKYTAAMKEIDQLYIDLKKAIVEYNVDKLKKLNTRTEQIWFQFTFPLQPSHQPQITLEIKIES